jgi:hypothetical protein
LSYYFHMNSEHLKIAFMLGIIRADKEAGITLTEHLHALEKKAFKMPWGMLAAPALGAGLGAAISPGREEQGIAMGALGGMGAYAAGRGLLRMPMAMGKALLGARKAVPAAAGAAEQVAAKAAPAAAKAVGGAAASAVPTAAQRAAAAAPTVITPTPGGAAPASHAPAPGAKMSPWKAGLMGAGAGAGAGYLGSKALSPPQTTPEEQAMLDQYRIQQQQQAQQQQMGSI